MSAWHVAGQAESELRRRPVAKVKRVEPLLCERPEVLELVTVLTLLLDHVGDNRPGILIDNDSNVQTFDAKLMAAVKGVGFHAEWANAKRGRRKFVGLHVRYPSAAVAKRAKKTAAG